MEFNQFAYVDYPYLPYYTEENYFWNLNRRVDRFEGAQSTSGYAMARQGVISLEEILKNKVSTFRRWKPTKLYKKHSKWNFQFSLMTYNILSQIAVENHRYLYRHCDDAFLQEEYRISRILPEILSSKSDIICLQEVEQFLYDNRIKKLFDTRGFESIFKRKTGGKTDGCAILWRKKKFDLIEQAEVEFKAKGNKYLNKDNIGLIAVFKPNHPYSGSTKLHVATTHLIFNPKRGEVKLCQLRLLLAELEKMALREVVDEERIYHPTILCGDFNMEPGSPLHHFIESGSIDITEALSGDLSGQREGKNKGAPLNRQQLCLQKLGISESSRYENVPVDKDLNDSMNVCDNSDNSCSATTQNNSPLFQTSELNDPCIVAAIGSSKDPRWVDTLKAIGQEQLASDLASRINSESSNVPKGSNSVESPRRSPKKHISSGANEIHFTHDFKFAPVYKFHRYTGNDMPITSMTGYDFNTVDNIFYNVSKKQSADVFTEAQLRLLGYFTLMRTDEIKDIGGLPNAHLGSDHLALIGQFGMNFKR